MLLSYIRPCGDVFDPVATHLLRSIPCARQQPVVFADECLQKHASLFEVSLCLSRACHGKVII